MKNISKSPWSAMLLLSSSWLVSVSATVNDITIKEIKQEEKIDFGLGFGETGYLQIFNLTDVTNTSLVVFITGPTGFTATVEAEPKAGYKSGPLHVGNGLNSALIVLDNAVNGAIQDALVAGLKGVMIGPEAGIAAGIAGGVVGAAKGTLMGLFKIATGSSEDYDIYNIDFFPAAAGTYLIRIDNPQKHPWSKNTAVVKTVPVEESELASGLDAWFEVSPNPCQVGCPYDGYYKITNYTSNVVTVNSYYDEGFKQTVNVQIPVHSTRIVSHIHGESAQSGRWIHDHIIFTTSVGIVFAPTYVFVVESTGETPGSAEKVTVPKLFGVRIERAKAMLQNLGLKVGNISYQVSNEWYVGYVIGQQPAAGTEVPKGTAVDLVVSTVLY